MAIKKSECGKADGQIGAWQRKCIFLEEMPLQIRSGG
jgi:hypothetical protein